MTLAAAVIVDTSLVLAIGLIAAMALRRRSASLRHWVLVATMIAAALTPALELMLPPWRLAFAAPSLEIAGTAPLTITSEPPAASPTLPTDMFGRPGGFDGGQLLVALWIAGTFVGLVGLCAGLWRLSRLATRAHAVTEGPLRQSMDVLVATPRQCRVRLLLQATHPGLVVTWGMRRPTILLPASATEWSESCQRAVLLHELAHVERGDWAMRMFALAMRCAFWFNPLMWIVDRRVQHESERACDDEVMRAGVSGTDYAGHLLAVAREAIGGRRSWSPATAVAQPSTLEERIHAMLTTGTQSQTTRPPFACCGFHGTGRGRHSVSGREPCFTHRSCRAQRRRTANCSFRNTCKRCDSSVERGWWNGTVGDRVNRWRAVRSAQRFAPGRRCGADTGCHRSDSVGLIR